MIGLFCFVLAVLGSPFKSKLRLEAENAVLRHQSIVLRRRLHGRVRLTDRDRWFLIRLYRWFPRCAREALRTPRDRMAHSSAPGGIDSSRSWASLWAPMRRMTKADNGVSPRSMLPGALGHHRCPLRVSFESFFSVLRSLDCVRFRSGSFSMRLAFVLARPAKAFSLDNSPRSILAFAAGPSCRRDGLGVDVIQGPGFHVVLG
jgi:hypothetical protein